MGGKKSDSSADNGVGNEDSTAAEPEEAFSDICAFLNLSRTNVPSEVVRAIVASAGAPSRSALTLGLEGAPLFLFQNP